MAEVRQKSLPNINMTYVELQQTIIMKKRRCGCLALTRLHTQITYTASVMVQSITNKPTLPNSHCYNNVTKGLTESLTSVMGTRHQEA